MDELSITECRRQEMEVSSKIEDKMDAMMMRIEQGMRMNDEANKSRCEANAVIGKQPDGKLMHNNRSKGD